MHGLINRAIQSFVSHTYGSDRWEAVARRANLGHSQFEGMLTYDDSQTFMVLDAISEELHRTREEVLEDLGTYLITHPEVQALRRLLRFSGVTYEDFLFSLDDLPDRTRLAVADLHLPALEPREKAPGEYTLTCAAGLPGYGWVVMGVLRAMADDYGALAILHHEGIQNGSDVISIGLVEATYSKGREFDLGARTG